MPTVDPTKDIRVPRLTPGDIMIFDDYGMINCPGAKLAIGTFFADKPVYPYYLPSGQAVIVHI